MQDQPNSVPTRKVTAGALAGALVAVGTWLTPADEPAGVVAALVVIATFVTSYFVRED